jgi:uncharacterized damage-inducible protein DinB
MAVELKIPARQSVISFGEANDHAIDYLVGILHDARTTTLERVQGATLEELDWRYADGWNTVGALLHHVISLENFFRIRCIEEREIERDEMTRWGPGMELGKWVPELGGKTLPEYVAELDEARALTLAGLRGVRAEDFFRRRAGLFEPEGYNLAWVLYHQAEDEVHHRGQISIIRKLYASMH